MSTKGVIKAPTASVREMDGHCCARSPPFSNELSRSRARTIAMLFQGRLLPALSPAMGNRVPGDRGARLMIEVLVDDIMKSK
jgi:hypothetical protein